MATHDYVISNASGASVRADLNNALAAIVSNNSNATSPATTYAYQWWADTTTGQLKLRNSANSAWITIFELDGTMLMEDGTESAPGLAFASDLNTGFFRPSADHLYISTGGGTRVAIKNSEVVINEPSNDLDFRVESNGNTHMLYVDGGNDKIGINTSSPGCVSGGIHVVSENAEGTPTASGAEAAIFQRNFNSAQDCHIAITAGTAGSSSINFGDKDDGDIGIIRYDHANNAMAFSANASERVRIDSSGNLQIKTGEIDLQGGDKTVKTSAGFLQVGTSGSHHTSFITGNSERARIDTSGKLIVGHSSATDVGDVQSQIQVVGADAATGSLTIRRDQNASGGASLLLGKSRSGSRGGNTIVQANDTIGQVVFNAADGTDVATGAARIKAAVDGTPGSNDMPGRLVFETTPDGSNSLTERLRIDSSGRVGINVASPGCLAGGIHAVHDNSEGTPSFTGGEVAIFQRNFNSAQGCHVGIIGGTAGTSSINFGDKDDADVGIIQYGHSDNTMRFFTNTGERMRITSGGLFKFSNTGAFGSIDANAHGFRQGSSGNWALEVVHAATSGNLFGMHSQFPSLSPNNTTSWLYLGSDSSANRFIVYSNGGIANYQSNNANLCDEREKKNIESLDSTWSCLKNWELKKFHYNEDSDTDDKRYGVIAQQVAAHCPELITDWLKQKAADAVLDDDGNVVTPAKEQILRKGVKEQQMMWMAIKALQEAQTRIETLEAKVAALEAG